MADAAKALAVLVMGGPDDNEDEEDCCRDDEVATRMEELGVVVITSADVGVVSLIARTRCLCCSSHHHVSEDAAKELYVALAASTRVRLSSFSWATGIRLLQG